MDRLLWNDIQCLESNQINGREAGVTNNFKNVCSVVT